MRDALEVLPGSMPDSPADGYTPRFRSGAVARMLAMPVSTLRVWERRYGLGGAELSAGGHRLYSTADVQRLAHIRRLTQLGHAIGSLAGLDPQGLLAVSAAHAQARSVGSPVASPQRPRVEPAEMDLVVIGPGLARRLQLGGLPPGVRLSVREEPPGLTPRPTTETPPAGHGRSLWLADAPRLDTAAAKALQQQALRSGAVGLAMVYGYARRADREACEAAGVALLPQAAGLPALKAWLQARIEAMRAAPEATVPAPVAPALAAPAANADPAGAWALTLTWAETAQPPARRHDDLALADWAALSGTIACECPQHVAQLLLQLSHFEQYSAECAQQSVADAELHRYLQRMAGHARALLERALERIAVHEGWMEPT